MTLTNQWARGRVFFKFNTSFLTEDAYIERVNNCFTEYQNNQTMENNGLEWEYIKCEIRALTISYASYRKKENKKHLEQLENRFEI